MSDTPRAIDLQIEVPGTPEQVWQAIATGPGISSWYVPHTVEERPGGTMTASFGSAPEMQVNGRVAAWEPPHRLVFDKGEGVPGLAFEWLVEARDGGTCVVRLINTGFGDGAEWDDQYDGMHEGWQLFLTNLRLHREHFAGRPATAALPMALWPSDPDTAWHRLASALALPDGLTAGWQVSLDPGDRSSEQDGGMPVGTVTDVAPRRVAVVLEAPAPGTAFVVVEGSGETCGVSVWAYLYGDERDAHAARFEATWQGWLDARAEELAPATP
jgi:uncharacterized protein YndB with AHSA1/START domain